MLCRPPSFPPPLTLVRLRSFDCEQDSFPLGLTKRWVSRPSSREQHFIRNTLCLTGASIAFYHYLLPFVLDRELLHAKVQAFTEFVVGKVQEKVVEPLEELAQELFDTIRSRETIVTKRDLELSKQVRVNVLNSKTPFR